MTGRDTPARRHEGATTNGAALTGRGVVVVGVDPSRASRDALKRAAAEAAGCGWGLQLVHAFAWPLIWPPLTAPDQAVPGPRQLARELLADAAARVGAEFPQLPVATRLVDGGAAEVLVTASRQASLLVVGARGHGGFAELLAGSTAVQVVAHAACPVLVVRGSGRADRPVVVGVDGSAPSRLAVEFAFDSAARHCVPLVAVHAWPADRPWPPDVIAAGYTPPSAPDVVADSLDGYPAKYPDVEVRRRVVRGEPAGKALVDASADAGLVVVGSRGLGGFGGLLLGSVSQALVHHGHCPVVVVRPVDAG